MLLPDHIHTIWTLHPNDPNFALRWQLIKRYVTQSCGARLNNLTWMNVSKTKHRESTLWQRRYWEYQIRDELDYAKHMDYLHYNPVKHQLVYQVKDWPYSTFHRYVKQDVYIENQSMQVLLNESEFGDG